MSREGFFKLDPIRKDLQKARLICSVRETFAARLEAALLKISVGCGVSVLFKLFCLIPKKTKLFRE